MSLPFAYFVGPLVLPRKCIKSMEVCQQSTENQVYISLHLQTDQQHKSFTTPVVSLNSSDLFLAVLLYMQEQ